MGGSSADKRIPVREETWKKLGELKEAGKTYDDLLEELMEEHKKHSLFKRLEEIEEESEFVPLEDV